MAESIRSVWSQTYRPLELVIVDDGSNDETPAVIEEFLPESRARVDSVVFVRQRNRGLVPTLNRAIRLARGDYVSVIASDDICLPHKIEQLLAAPEWSDDATAAAFGDACYIDGEGAPIARFADGSFGRPDEPGTESLVMRHHLRHRPSPLPEPLGTYESLLRGAYIPACATLIRTRQLLAAGGYDSRFVMEDSPLWLKFARTKPLVFVDDVVAQKRFHGGNMQHVEQRRLIRDYVVMLMDQDRYCRDDVRQRLRREATDAMLASLFAVGRRRDLLKAFRLRSLVATRDLLGARRRTRIARQTSST